jgi:WD40 repeat protein
MRAMTATAHLRSLSRRYTHDTILCGTTSVAFSGSGRYLYAAYEDYTCHAWDTQTATQAGIFSAHVQRVSCLGASSDGETLCTVARGIRPSRFGGQRTSISMQAGAQDVQDGRIDR